MHYERRLLGGVKSTLDGPEFFLAKDGATDPLAELKASLEAFEEPPEKRQIGRLKQPAQCAFPERLRFLREKFSLTPPAVKCAKYEEYISQFKAKSVTLVFSSAYPNNPGSMFGHTFLRINSSQRSEILDYGVSFAAIVPPDEGTVAYMALGLMGGYRGQYSMQPYYVKVNEYVNSESRDLWEYELNLTEAETLRLLAHLWELETTSWFDYYFFDENCSYQLLAAIQAVKPEWELMGFGMHTVPSDTVKRLTDIPGAVRRVEFRPALRKKLLQRVEALTPEERETVQALVKGTRAPESVDSAFLLESAALNFQYLKQKQQGKLDDADSARMRAVLERRSRLGQAPEHTAQRAMPTIPQDSRPDTGHDTYRVGVAAGSARSRFFQEIELKLAYHDLLNADSGYVRFSQIDFPSLRLRRIGASGDESASVQIEQLQIAAITSLSPWNFIDRRISWRLQLDYFSPKDFGCDTCHALHFETGAGIALEALTPDILVYGLLLADLQAGSSIAQGVRFGPKLRLATLMNPFGEYKLHAHVQLASDLFQSSLRKLRTEIGLDQAYGLSRHWDIRLNASEILRSAGAHAAGAYREVKLNLNHYF